jgi:hypothetical protein
MARMWKRIRALGLASAAAFLTAALITAAPVQAGITDCIDALAPADDFAKAAKTAAEAAQCVGQAAGGDAVMAATIAAMTAAYAGGAFSDTEQCMGMIDGVIGKMLAAAILQGPAADILQLSDDTKKQLQDFADGVGTKSFTDLVNSNQALQVLFLYINCGCQVAGAPGTYDQLLNDYAKHVEGCAGIVADAAAFVADVIESGIDAVGEGIKKVVEFTEKCLTDACGLFDDDDGSECVTHVFPKSQFGKLVPYDIKDSVFMGTCGVWVCAEGGHPITHVVQGKTLNTCSYCYGTWALDSTGKCAPCGGTLQKKIGTGHTWKTGAAPMCLTAVTGYPDYAGAHCTITETMSCCAPGQRMQPAGWDGEVNCDPQVIGGPCTNIEQASAQCVGACKPTEYFDTDTGKCASCAPDSIPVYDSDPKTNSIGQCKQCPLGLSGEGNLTCQPCGPGEVIWSLTPPKKQDGLATQTLAGPGGGTPKKQDSAATKKKAAPVAGPPGLAPSDAAVPPPPPGQHADTMTALPGGPIGGLVNGGRCMACPENWFPVYYHDARKNSLGYCKECDPGTYLDVPKLSQVPPKDPITGEWLVQPQQPKCVPLNCPAGLDPKNPHACRAPVLSDVAKPVVPVPGGGPGVVVVPGGVVSDGPAHRPCPPGTRPAGGACVPAASTVVPKRSLTCPPGQVLNAAGTSCIRIGKAPPNVRDVAKRPAMSTAPPGKRRPAQWLLKRRTSPGPTPIPIPIPR